MKERRWVGRFWWLGPAAEGRGSEGDLRGSAWPCADGGSVWPCADGDDGLGADREGDGVVAWLEIFFNGESHA